MPPSSKRKVRDRTKDAPGSPEGERAQRTRGLDPAVVKQFLGMLQRRDRLGPDFFADGELLQWNEWLDAVPARAAEAPATLHSAEASFEALGIRHDMLAFTPADGGGSAPHLHGEAVLHAWPHLLRWSRGLLVRTHRARVQQVASERLQDAWRKAMTEARATSAPSVQRRPRSAVAQGGVKRAQPLLMAAGSQSPRYRRYSTPSSSRDGGVE